MRSELLGLALLALTACPGSIDDPSVFAEVDCPTFMDRYLAETCGASCHNSVRKEGDLDLQTKPLAPRLVGAPGSQAGCDASAILDVDQPEQSLLYLKLSEDLPPCGDPMPLVGRRLAPGELECLLDWIAAQPRE
jgi:hypothetical protein